MPAVSVVIPAYNRRHLVPDAIESVLAQTLRDVEVIVVDDGSTDRTADHLSRRFGRSIRIERLPHNCGRSAARNVGWTLSRGEFVAFLDSDDMWAPEKLARQIPCFDNPRVSLVHSMISVVGPNGEPIPQRTAEMDRNFRASLARGYSYDEITQTWCRLYTSASVLRRDAIREIGGFDESLSHFEDWDLLWRAALIGEVATVQEPLLLYRSYPGNTAVTATWYLSAPQWLKVMRKHLAAIEALPGLRRARRNLHVNMAIGHYWRRDYAASRRSMWRALALDTTLLATRGYCAWAAPLAHAVMPHAIASRAVARFNVQNYDSPPAPPPRDVTIAVDDGPSPSTAELLDTLELDGHRAVLFVLGSNIPGREPVLIDAIRRGFALANHSLSHPRFSSLSASEAAAELAATETRIDALYAAAGVPRAARWFRFPYLDSGNGNAPELQSVLRDMGFRPHPSRPSQFDWPTTCQTSDWSIPDDADFRRAVSNAVPGDIIEIHDKAEVVPRYTPILVEELARQSLRGTVPTQ